MIKIIDGKRYNTDTSEELVFYWNGLPSNDFRAVTEYLYRTPKGALFLLGIGGPMTEYAESCGNNSWSGGRKIRPLTRSEALEWCERRGEDVPECLADLVTDA